MSFIVSIRLWVFLSIALAYLIMLMPAAAIFALDYKVLILSVNAGVLTVSLFLSIFGTYNTESVSEFISDIKGDVIMWGFSLGSLVHLYTETGFTGNSMPLWILVFCLGATTGDLAFSLNGGASKLLEMDKDRTSIDKWRSS